VPLPAERPATGRHLVAALLLTALLGACSPARLDSSLTLLRDLSAGPSADAEIVLRTETAFTADGRAHMADLYATPQVRADLVLVPGAVRGGRRDPRLVAFAETLARAEFRVLVPELAAMRALQVTSDDARILAAAAGHLRAQAPERPRGVAAVSFAVGPAVLAVDAGAPIDFVVAIGGYHDLEAAIAYFTTGRFRAGPDEPWRYRAPNAYGKWVFVLSNVPRLDDAKDRRLLRRMAERRLADLDAEIEALVAELGPEGRAVYALLVNDDPERVPALVDGLPSAIRDEIDALDLANLDFDAWDRPAIATQFVLIHGRDDPVIPATQSEALARALGPERSELYLVGGLRHIDPGDVGLAGSLTLLRATYRVLTLRDGGASVLTP
jgi:pimeloyl-ACP methyl ester carboxylesterase